MKKALTLLKHFLKKYQLPFLSGILIGTSYIPFPPWAALFGFVPLWIYILRASSLKQVLFGAWITQFILTFIGFNWVAHTIHEFGFMPWSIAITGLVLFCSFANLYIPIAAGVFFLLNQRLKLTTATKLLLLACITALAEPNVLTIFEWNFGYTWYWSNFPIYQMAEFIGFQGLSSLIIFLNANIAYFWLNRDSKKGSAAFASAILIFCFLNLLGFVAEKNIAVPNAITRPLIVQANISNQQKVYAEQGYGFRDFILTKFLRLTQEGLQQDQYPDFAVWPETAFPEYMNDFYYDRPIGKKLKAFLAKNNLALITGGYSKDISSKKTGNSIFFLNNQGEHLKPRYNKTNLLAFGEFLPGAKLFPKLKKLLPMVSDFHRGVGPQVNDFNGLKVGSQLCYESLDPDFTRKLSDMGAEVIINATNDSWFGRYQEPYQHLYMTLARSVEFRRPVIRSTNTGISTVALANGTVLKKSPIGQEWSHTFIVPYHKNPSSTFYQRFSMLIPGLILLSTLLLLAFGIHRKRKN